MKINFTQLHQKLFDSLPGCTKKHFFLVERKEYSNNNAILLHGIEKFFNETECPWDTVILTREIWHYPDIEKIIASHPALQNKNVFLVTLGYKQYQFGQSCWKINWPWPSIQHFRYYRTLKSYPKPKNLPFGFGSLNGRTAVHRIILGHELYCKGLLDKVMFTQSTTGPLDAEIFNTLPKFEEYKKLLPISVDNVGYINDHFFDHRVYKESYCNIVTETETEIVPYEQNQNIEILTEKSSKPWFAMQIPLIIGGRGHMAYLKYLGFEIMEDLTPPDYDQMRTLDKISAIVDIVARGRDYIEDFYFSHLREIQHNYELATSGTVEDKIIADIQQLINS